MDGFQWEVKRWDGGLEHESVTAISGKARPLAD